MKGDRIVSFGKQNEKFERWHIAEVSHIYHFRYSPNRREVFPLWIDHPKPCSAKSFMIGKTLAQKPNWPWVKPQIRALRRLCWSHQTAFPLACVLWFLEGTSRRELISPPLDGPCSGFLPCFHTLHPPIPQCRGSRCPWLMLHRCPVGNIIP